MDGWEELVEGYQEKNDPRFFSKLLHSAEVLVNDDLTPFEVDYLLSTLLYKPFNLLQTVRDKRTCDEWDKCITDTLKLLSVLIFKYDNTEIYYEDIVSLCLLHYDARTRQLALTCLTNIVRKSVVGVKDYNRHINALEETNTCKAPLALLVGAICEYHWNIVSEDIYRIWRVFLNLLDCNKQTVSVHKAVLQGILSLFKHFGVELMTIELDCFYEKLVTFTKISRCEDVCLSIFQNFSHLFRERITNDLPTRQYIWSLINNDGCREAIISVYTSVANTVSQNKIQDIITELQEHAKSTRYQERFSALYALTAVHSVWGLGDLNEYIDIHTVEFEIRNGNINYEICEAVFWCVKSKVLYSDRLLQISLLFYDTFPATRRGDLLRCLVQADEEIRKSAIIFLTNYPQSMVWRDIFNDADNMKMDTKCIVEDALDHIILVLEREEDKLMCGGILPDTIRGFASLLTLLPPHGSFRVLKRYARVYPEFVPSAYIFGNSDDGLENISIENCINDEEKLRCCLSYIDMLEGYKLSEMIIALEMILSKNNIGALNLRRALHKLEKLIQDNELNENELARMLRRVNIISKRINKSKKEDRILERDVIMFQAKYGRTMEDITPNYYEFAESLENTLILEVDDVLKLKLQRVLTTAIEYEDKDALKMLLNVISAKLAIKNDSTLQKAVLSVIVALSRCDVTSDEAAHWWVHEDDVLELLQYIIKEKSPKSRNILLGILEKMPDKYEGDLLEKILENLLFEEHDNSIDQAILEVLGLLIKLLVTDNLLSKKYLPHIIIRVLKIKKYNVNTFKMAADMFTDKIELFDGNTVDDIVGDILNVLNSMRNEDLTLNIKTAMELIKKIFDLKKNSKDIIQYYFDGGRKINLLILIEIKCVFNLDYEKCQELLTKNDFLRDFFVRYDEDYTKDGAVFDFVCAYSENILKYNSEETYRLLSKVIENLTPHEVSSNKLSVCLSLLRSHDEITYTMHMPQAISVLIKKYPIEEITVDIQKYLFKSKHELLVSDLVKFDHAESILMEFTRIKEWVKWVMLLHDSGFIERNLSSKIEYMMDLVDLSLRLFTQDDLKDLMLQNKTDECIHFFRTFMRVSYKYLIRKPYVFLISGLEHSCVLLIDIVKSALRDNKNDQVLELVETLWSTFCNINVSWKQKLCLLNSLPVLPANIEEWVWEKINESNLNIANKIEIVMATNNKIGSIYTKLCPHLPSRLSELSGTSATCFRVLLDILSRKNFELVDLVARIASNDDTKGWWDDAMQMCMSGIAKERQREGDSILSQVYASCLENRGHSTSRLLLPLLRYSKSVHCETFFSEILEDLLSTLKVAPRASTGHYIEEKCIHDYVRALNIIEVILEKVPKKNIDSPDSVLYSKIAGVTTPFFLVTNVCKLCVTLRDRVDGSYRLFHRANYNCLVAAICLRDPSPNIYRILFDPKVWGKLIDEEELQLPIREQWNYRMTRHAAPHLATEVSLRTASVKTRMFTRTLSENPFQYDLTHEETEVNQPQEIQLKDSPLNRHQCMAAFKVLLNKENAIQNELCRKELENTLKTDETPVNVKWLLAQAICNSKEELKAYASSFQPALFAVIIKTAKNNILNDLHVDIIDCFILWKENANVNNEEVNKTIEYIINTAINYRARKNIYYSLLDRLVKLLDIWQNAVIPWTIFENHFTEKDTDILKICLNIIKNISKSNKYVPELLPALIRAIEEKNFFIEICELLGMALSLEKNNTIYLKRFQEVLANLRRTNVSEYIKLLYYTQKGYPMVCEENNVRVITDLVPKLTNGREKLKCLQILDIYVRNARGIDDVTVLFETISIKDHLHTAEGLSLAKNGLRFMSEQDRETIVIIVLKESYTKQMLAAAADFLIEVVKLQLKSDDEPQAKRPARESNSKLLCNKFIRNILKVLSEWDSVNGLNEVLDENLKIRFYESFYITIVFSKLKSETNLYKMLKLFFQGIKGADSDENKGVSKGAPSSAFETSLEPSSDSSQITECDTIQSLLKFCQRNLQVAVTVTVELLKTYSKSPRFEFVGDEIVNLLRDATPWLIEVLRTADIWESDGLQQVLEELTQKSKGTEAEDLAKLLYEDFKLHRFGLEQFVLGLNTKVDENMPEVSTQFSMDDLIFAFGKLSNWDDLSIQQKKNIKNELPCLWTTTDNFKNSVFNMDYEGPMWFNAMVSNYKNDNSFSIPQNVYKWPRNYFDVSVMAEISTWNELRDAVDTKNIIFNDIQPSDCMAQWTARIMMRSLYLHTLHQREQALSLSRSNAASWCVRASEMALHAQMLHCCKTVTDLYENEMLQWFRFKLLALREIGLEKNDRDSLEKALRQADEYVPQFLKMSTAEDITGIRLVTIQLRNDLKTLERNHIKDVLTEIESLSQSKRSEISTNCKKDLEKLCILSMTFFDQCDSEQQPENRRKLCENDIYLQMARILSFYVQMDLGEKKTLLADVIINRLDGYKFGRIPNILGREILNTLQPIINDLNYISIDRLASHLFMFENELKSYLQEDKMDKIKKCLSLVGDADYLLLSYCQHLEKESDPIKFKKIFNDMKTAIFENPFAQSAPNYQVLNTHKEKLYGILCEADTKKRKETLSNIILQLNKSVKGDYVYLSRLCPTLTNPKEIEDERDTLSKLFRLKPGIYVVKFEEKIQVMTGSIRRPAILKCRLSNGRSLRCMVKRGEWVRIHCSAIAINTTLGLRGGYRITPLSDDCCLIEYLENHAPLRNIISSKYNIDIPEVDKRAKDDELILDRERSLEEFQMLCKKIPSYLLRSAIEESCTSVEDFIYKKKTFLQSICDMTVFSYICGMSDRHLENIMYNKQDGGACHVDCAAILQDHSELPPARLTRNILALCDTQVLESRLQTKFLYLRENQHILLSSICIAFKWMGQKYMEKFNHTRNLIQGKVLSHNKAIEVLSKSKQLNKERYIQMLEEIFEDFTQKNEYTVEEQVSSLLRLSTDRRILSVTRTGWEPWI